MSFELRNQVCPTWRNFLYGVGTLANLFPTYPESDPGSAVDRPYPFQSDAEALAYDWAALRGDLQRALEIEKNNAKHKA